MDLDKTGAIDPLVTAAQAGDRVALERLVRHVQEPVYRLCVRMLVDRDEALSASQEILVLIVTKLSTFEGRSRLSTWVHRIALNYLISQKRKQRFTFEMFEEDLATGATEPPAELAEDTTLLNEVRVACTMAMLLCLDIDHRAAYVLGEIFELDHNEASEALGISPASYRKRLSRARKDVLDFTQRRCGLASEAADCHCRKRLVPALALRRVRRGEVLHAEGAPDFETTVRRAEQLAGELRAMSLQKAGPTVTCPKDLSAEIRRVLESSN